MPTTMDEAEHSRSVRRRRFLLPLIVLFAVADVAAMLSPQILGWEEVLAFILGTSFAQVILCAYWAALGSSRLAWRWPASAMLVALCWLVLCIVLQITFL